MGMAVLRRSLRALPAMAMDVHGAASGTIPNSLLIVAHGANGRSGRPRGRLLSRYVAVSSPIEEVRSGFTNPADLVLLHVSVPLVRSAAMSPFRRHVPAGHRRLWPVMCRHPRNAIDGAGPMPGARVLLCDGLRTTDDGPAGTPLRRFPVSNAQNFFQIEGFHFP